MSKRLFSFYLVAIITININAIKFSFPAIADTINRVGAGGDKVGFWVIRDNEADFIKEKGNYVGGKKNGVWKSFYANGSKKSEITYTNGLAKGKARFYYENGTLWESGIWQVNHWEGNYKFYHKNGNISYDWNYDNKGKRSGEQKYYYPNGKKKYAGIWENGKTRGVLKCYNEAGVLVEEKRYKDGKISSVNTIDVVKEQNGTELKENNAVIKFSGSGFHTIYNLSGNIGEKGIYEKGILVDGERYLYDADNLLLKILMIKEGLEVGFRRP